MIVLAFPWTPFVFTSLANGKPSRWRKNDAVTKCHVFAIAWLIVPIAFFSLSVSKLPGYVLPALPGAALLVGEGLVQFLRGERKRIVIRITGVLLLCVVIAGIIYARHVQLVSNACLILMAAPMTIAGLISLVRTRQPRACVIILISAILVSTLFAVSCISDRVSERESVRRLMQLASSRGYSDAPVYGLHTIEHTAEFYAAGRYAYDADGKPIRLEGPQQVLPIARESNRTVLVIIPVEYVGQLTGYAPVEAEVIGDNGTVALVAVRAR
jgi:hypothetical protein